MKANLQPRSSAEAGRECFPCYGMENTTTGLPLGVILLRQRLGMEPVSSASRADGWHLQGAGTYRALWSNISRGNGGSGGLFHLKAHFSFGSIWGGFAAITSVWKCPCHQPMRPRCSEGGKKNNTATVAFVALLICFLGFCLLFCHRWAQGRHKQEWL